MSATYFSNIPTDFSDFNFRFLDIKFTISKKDLSEVLKKEKEPNNVLNLKKNINS